LSTPLAQAVAGRAPLAHPALVWNVAIGQSTLVTVNVRANLFYRGLLLHRQPEIGDTLSTRTVVEELRRNAVRPGRPATGLAVLHITTTDQHGRTVLDFHRCAMLPLGDAAVDTGHHEALALGAADLDDATLAAVVEDWRLPSSVGDLVAGQRFRILGGDVVSGAAGLARLTLNIAAVHHDATAAGGRRLVYGGHTIAIALAQATRALPELVTVLGWHSCDHIAPVHEGDRLTSTVEIERVTPAPGGGRLLHLRSRVSGEDAAGGEATPVLDWRFVALSG
jgi:acyl dehydratase